MTTALGAAAVFALLQMFGAAAMGASTLWPLRMAASVFLGRDAFDASMALVVPIAVVVHVSLALSWGFFYGHLSTVLSARTRKGFGRQAVIGLLFGTIVWLFDFHLVARLVFPWFLETTQLGQWALHAFGFGLPLALMFASEDREAFEEREAHRRASDETSDANVGQI